MQIESIPIGIIDEPSEPHRLAMDPQALQELADSIRLEGLKNPIAVRPSGEGRYEIIAGHRRYMAHRQIGAIEIMCIVRDADTTNAEVERFIENNQREQLTPMEEALALSRFIDTSGLEPDVVAKRMGKSAHWLNTRMQLMGIPDVLKAEVHAGRLAIGSALHLARVTDESHRDHLMRYAIEGGASTTVIRQWVDTWEVHAQNPTSEPAPAPTWQPGDSIVIIQIPCAVCGEPHEHTKMTIVRTCNPCLDVLAALRADNRQPANSG